MINDTAIHSGNYYMAGVRRVLAKLAEMGVEVPSEALSLPPHEGVGTPLREFTRIEHAMLDWFEGRDYEQAQALIHFQQSRNEWHVIHILDEEKAPRDISHEMLSPSRLDALVAVLASCDRDTVRLDACRNEGDALVVVINCTDVFRIEPVVMEPFDLALRNRVRTAFKGVRHYDQQAILDHALRLPGFKSLALDNGHYRHNAEGGCMLLGFPGNWAFAMRHALKQVGITVKQSQAHELSAVFFGANHWHQLIKHQDEQINGLPPVAVTVEGRTRFYHTTEEALFTVGKEIESFPEPVVMQHFGLSLDNHHITFWAARQSVMSALPPTEQYLCPNCIESGANDYGDAASYGMDEVTDAARRMLETIGTGKADVSTLGVLYDGADDTALLESLLGREGIPPSQIVPIGDYVLAVSYVPEPNGSEQLAAHLQIFQITHDGLRKAKDGDVSMYKAEVRIIKGIDGLMLVIRPDYGKGAPFEIPVAQMAEVDRLVALTHRAGIFTLEVVDFGESRPLT